MILAWPRSRAPRIEEQDLWPHLRFRVRVRLGLHSTSTCQGAAFYVGMICTLAKAFDFLHCFVPAVVPLPTFRPLFAAVRVLLWHFANCNDAC